MGQGHNGKVKDQGHTMTLHIHTPQPISLTSINFLHLMVSEIEPRKKFIRQGHYMKIKAQTRPSASENQSKLYPPERKLTQANKPSLNLEGGVSKL